MRARARRIPILVTVAVGLALAAAPVRPCRGKSAGEVSRSGRARSRGRGAGLSRARRRGSSDGCGASGPTTSSRSCSRCRHAAGRTGQVVPAQPARAPERGARLGQGGRVEARPVVNRIVVRLGARRIEVRRIRDGRLLLRSAAAIGAFGSETPRRAELLRPVRVRANGPVLRDVRAGDVSAYARVTDWPSNVVGIHGTNLPALLGQAVSHGCVRVPNASRHGSGGLRRSARVVDVVR